MDYKDILPKIKLSYEPWSHNKVYDADLVVWIPDGPKYFLWVANQMCILLSIQGTVEKTWECIEEKGTLLLYGTLLQDARESKKRLPFFAVERVCYNEGRVWKRGFVETCQRLLILFKNIQQPDFLFGFPLIEKKVSTTVPPYRVKCIAYHRGDTVMYGYEKKREQDRVFLVKPELQNDIYHLFSENEPQPLVACIPDYKTSVMMNRLFRRIKENENLDALEESDDEVEFEDCREDKFVSLEKSYRMICHWHPRFKKWVPISLYKK